MLAFFPSVISASDMPNTAVYDSELYKGVDMHFKYTFNTYGAGRRSYYSYTPTSYTYKPAYV